jgi:hypothetical protein
MYCTCTCVLGAVGVVAGKAMGTSRLRMRSVALLCTLIVFCVCVILVEYTTPFLLRRVCFSHLKRLFSIFPRFWFSFFSDRCSFSLIVAVSQEGCDGLRFIKMSAARWLPPLPPNHHETGSPSFSFAFTPLHPPLPSPLLWCLSVEAGV